MGIIIYIISTFFIQTIVNTDVLYYNRVRKNERKYKMLNFKINRQRVNELVAEDALATLDLLEQIKAEAHGVDTFAGRGVFICPAASSYLISKAAAVLNVDQKELVKASGLSSVSTNSTQTKESIRLITSDTGEEEALVSEEVFVIILEHLAERIQDFIDNLENIGQDEENTE